MMPVKKLKVAPVRRGARIRVISPSSYPQPDRLNRGVKALRGMGFDVSLGAHALAKDNGYFAGSAENRLADLHAAFLDSSVDAIISSRGGYGSNYLLPGLDLELIRRNPKPLLGYSDFTAVQTWLLDRLGLPAFHAPMAAADFARPDGVEEASLLAALGGERWQLDEHAGLRTLRPGKASGVLYGGCLSMLAASMGTVYEPATEGKLLFLEDCNEELYRLDRLLRQMVLGGNFAGVTGVVFGEMPGCLKPAQPQAELDAMILRVLDFIEGPIAIGLRSGHVSRANATLVFGSTVELDLTGAPRLEFLEPAAGGGIPARRG